MFHEPCINNDFVHVIIGHATLNRRSINVTGKNVCSTLREPYCRSQGFEKVMLGRFLASVQLLESQVRRNPVRCFPAYDPTFPSKTDRKVQSFV